MAPWTHHGNCLIQYSRFELFEHPKCVPRCNGGKGFMYVFTCETPQPQVFIMCSISRGVSFSKMKNTGSDKSMEGWSCALNPTPLKASRMYLRSAHGQFSAEMGQPKVLGTLIDIHPNCNRSTGCHGHNHTFSSTGLGKCSVWEIMEILDTTWFEGCWYRYSVMPLSWVVGRCLSGLGDVYLGLVSPLLQHCLFYQTIWITLTGSYCHWASI